MHKFICKFTYLYKSYIPKTKNMVKQNMIISAIINQITCFFVVSRYIYNKIVFFIILVFF